MKIGVTGHQKLSDSATWPWVREMIRHQLQGKEPLTGITNLAAGADQLFAECVLQAGGNIISILPFPGYERIFENKDDLARYIRLRNSAHEVRELPPLEDNEQSYLDAGIAVIVACDMLLTVWDGQPARGKGGTGEAVALALAAGLPVIHVNPEDRTVRASEHAGKEKVNDVKWLQVV